MFLHGHGLGKFLSALATGLFVEGHTSSKLRLLIGHKIPRCATLSSASCFGDTAPFSYYARAGTRLSTNSCAESPLLNPFSSSRWLEGPTSQKPFVARSSRRPGLIIRSRFSHKLHSQWRNIGFGIVCIGDACIHQKKYDFAPKRLKDNDKEKTS
jgi:hypothetical protein